MSTSAPGTATVTQTVTVRHPDAHLLARTGRGVVDTYKAIATGDWAALVDLCAHPDAGEKIINPAEAAIVLDEAAALSGYAFPAVGQLRTVTGRLLDEQTYEITGEPGMAASTLDLFMRLLCGQWDEIGWVCSMATQHANAGADHPIWDRYSLNVLRGRLCHHRDHPRYEEYRPLERHEFPTHPSASISIAQAVEPARLAYWVYKLLGAGAPGGPTFSLAGGPVTVTVDGVEKHLASDW